MHQAHIRRPDVGGPGFSSESRRNSPFWDAQSDAIRLCLSDRISSVLCLHFGCEPAPRGHCNILFAASLGISSTVAGVLGQHPMSAVSHRACGRFSVTHPFSGRSASLATLLAALDRVWPLGFACGCHALVVPAPEHITRTTSHIRSFSSAQGHVTARNWALEQPPGLLDVARLCSSG